MKTLSPEACTALTRFSVSSIGSGWHAETKEHLDRKIYIEVDEALRELGGKWKRGANAHIFDRDPTEALNALIKTGAHVSKKKDFGFFETPRALAAELVKTANIQPGMRVLEPSAGRGALVRAIFDAQPSAQVWAVELNPDLYAQLSSEEPPGAFTWQADFLTWIPHDDIAFDRVVMNPNFNKFVDVDHVLRAYSFLKPGGLLASIMSAAWTFRDVKKARSFRQLVEEYGSWKRLPKGSFSENGTNVETTLVTLRRES